MTVALILLLLAAPAASLHLSAHSNLALVPQVLNGVVQLQANTSDACACIPFKSAYDDHNVRCGQGFELNATNGRSYFKNQPREKLPNVTTPSGDDFYDEFCPNFYMRVSFAGCFKKKFGHGSSQWCYVSADCKADVTPVEGTDMAIKTCSSSDTLMSEAEPKKLNRLAAHYELDIGTLGKLSYPMMDEKWSDVESVSGLSVKTLEKTHTMFRLSKGMAWPGPVNKSGEEADIAKKKLAEVQRSGKPTLFDADGCKAFARNCEPGGVLVVGKQIYAYDLVGPLGPMGYVCVSNCK